MGVPGSVALIQHAFHNGKANLDLGFRAVRDLEMLQHSMVREYSMSQAC